MQIFGYREALVEDPDSSLSELVGVEHGKLHIDDLVLLQLFVVPQDEAYGFVCVYGGHFEICELHEVEPAHVLSEGHTRTSSRLDLNILT